jgi:hypothetical protein
MCPSRQKHLVGELVRSAYILGLVVATTTFRLFVLFFREKE